VQAVPDLLRRYVERCVPHGAPSAGRSLVEQVGEMRLGREGSWMPFTAEQWSSVDETAFCWHARVKMAALVTAVVEDAFEQGRGRLDAKIWGVVPVARGRGLAIDRGEIQRYLAELPWNPLAIMRNSELHFDEGSDGPLRVWCRDPDIYVDLRFDGDGDIVGTFSRTRIREQGEPCPWEGVFSDYADFGGIRVPSRAAVSWHEPAGKLEYWRGTVTRFTLSD
jgi:hypothetical protein